MTCPFPSRFHEPCYQRLFHWNWGRPTKQPRRTWPKQKQSPTKQCVYVMRKLCLYFHPGLLSGCWVNTQHGLSSSLENPQPFNHFSKDNIFGKTHLVSTRMLWGRLCVWGIASKFFIWSSVWISVTPSGTLPMNWSDVKNRWWQYLMESHVQNSVYNSSPCFVCGIFNALNRRHHTFSGKLWHDKEMLFRISGLFIGDPSVNSFQRPAIRSLSYHDVNMKHGKGWIMRMRTILRVYSARYIPTYHCAITTSFIFPQFLCN